MLLQIFIALVIHGIHSALPCKLDSQMSFVDMPLFGLEKAAAQVGEWVAKVPDLQEGADREFLIFYRILQNPDVIDVYLTEGRTVVRRAIRTDQDRGPVTAVEKRGWTKFEPLAHWSVLIYFSTDIAQRYFSCKCEIYAYCFSRLRPMNAVFERYAKHPMLLLIACKGKQLGERSIHLNWFWDMFRLQLAGPESIQACRGVFRFELPIHRSDIIFPAVPFSIFEIDKIIHFFHLWFLRCQALLTLPVGPDIGDRGAT